MSPFADATEQGFESEEIPRCCEEPMLYDLVSDRWACEGCDFFLANEVVWAFQQLDEAEA